MKQLSRSEIRSIRRAIGSMVASGILNEAEGSRLLGVLQAKCNHQGARYKPIRGTREEMDCSHCGLQELVTT